jgi:replicative DNA helicase
LESQIRKLRAEHQVELVFVDYLGLVDFADGSSLSRAEHIAKIIVALKALAVEIGISIICSHEIRSDKEEEKAISDAAIESCDVIIHINQGDNNEWDLLVSKRLTIAK